MPTETRRGFRYTFGRSNKFWIIELDSDSFTTHWGRWGTSGQKKTKQFSSPYEAKRAYDKIIAQKLKKGYVETGITNDMPGFKTKKKVKDLSTKVTVKKEIVFEVTGDIVNALEF